MGGGSGSAVALSVLHLHREEGRVWMWGGRGGGGGWALWREGGSLRGGGGEERVEVMEKGGREGGSDGEGREGG